MLQVDNLGRTIDGSIDVNALLGPVHTVVQTSAPGTEAKLTELYNAVNNLAARIDQAAAQELQAAREYARNVVSMKDSLGGSGGVRTAPTINAGNAAAYLQTTAQATQGINRVFKSRSTINVNLMSISSRASNSFKRILQSCGLCGVKETISAGRKKANARQAGDVALRTGAGGSGAGDSGTGDVALRTGGTGGDGGGGGGLMGSMDKEAKSFGDRLTGWGKDLAGFGPVIMKYVTDVTQIDGMNLVPSLKDLNAARQQVRHLVFLTRGFGDENREIEKTYRNIRSEASIAGVTMEVYQKHWLKNLEQGTVIISDHERIAAEKAILDDKSLSKSAKDQKLAKLQNQLDERRVKRSKSVTTSAIHTAQQLGMEAGAINETFMNWHMQLGLSAGAVGRIGSYMQEISRSTGVMGGKLQEAVKSSESIMKHLQRVGAFSEDSAKNILEMSTIMNKYGVGDLHNSIVTGTSSLEDFSKMEPKLKAAMIKAMSRAQSNGMKIDMYDLWSGRLSDPKVFKEFFEKGMGANAKDIISRITGMSVDNINLQELNKLMQSLPAAQRMVLENQLKQQGLVVGEIEATAKAMEEVGLSFGQKMANIQKQRDKYKKAFGSDADKMPEMLELARKEQEMTTQTQMNYLGQYVEAQRKVRDGTDPKAMDNFRKSLKENVGEIRDDKGNVTVDLAGNMMKSFESGRGIQDIFDGLKKRAEDAGISLNQASKLATGGTGKMFGGGMSANALQASLEKAMKEGDYDLVTEQLNKLGQEIAKKERVGQDPVTKAQDEMVEWHNTLAGAADKAASALGWLAGSAWGATVALQALAAIGALPAILRMGGGAIKGAWNWGKGKLGGVAGGAATTAAGGAATTAAGGAATTAAGAAPKGSWWSRLKNKFGGGGKAATSAAESAVAAETTAVSSAAKASKFKMPKLKGKAALAGLAIAGGAYLTHKLGWWGGDKNEATPSAEGGSGGAAMESNDVIQILKQIEINTRKCGFGEGTGVGVPGEGANAAIQPPESSGVGLGDLGMAAAIGSTMLMSSGGTAPKIPAPPAATAPKIPAAPAAPAASAMSAVESAPAKGGFFSRMWGGAKNAINKVKGVGRQAWETTKGAAGTAWNATKGAAGQAWDTTKGAVKTAGQYVLDKTGLTKVTEFFSSNIGKIVPKFLKTTGSTIRGGLGNILSKIPVLGAILQAVMTGMEVNDIAKQQGMSEQDLYSQMGSAVISGGLGLIGGSLAAAMTAIPQALGIPSWLFAPIAYMGGDWLGRLLGSAISDYVGGPTLGKLIFDLFYGGKPGAGAAEAMSPEATATAGAIESTDALNAFEVGTREIKQAGVAQLHAGEVIIPKEIWEKIKAIGSGAFGNTADGLMGSLDKMLGPGVFGGIVESLDKVGGIGALGGLAGAPLGAAGNIASALYHSLDRKTNAPEHAEKTGIVSTNPIDYGDETHTIASPMMGNYGSVEDSLERRHYTEHPGSASSTPSMDEVSDYLTMIQATKLDTMINYLRSIDEKLTPTKSSQVIGSRDGRSRPASRPGVKSMAMDLTTGAWEFTSTAYSPSAVTSEGRGGSG